MLSSYFANYLPLSRHHRTHNGPARDHNDSPNQEVTPQQQSMAAIFGGLKSNGAAVNVGGVKIMA
eukprot:scaffold39984_cov51-Cyclotella_meneghiniana.AAC.3